MQRTPMIERSCLRRKNISMDRGLSFPVHLLLLVLCLSWTVSVASGFFTTFPFNFSPRHQPKLVAASIQPGRSYARPQHNQGLRRPLVNPYIRRNASRSGPITVQTRQDYAGYYPPHIPHFPAGPSNNEYEDYLAESDEPLRLTFRPPPPQQEEETACEVDGTCQFILACWLQGGKVGGNCGPLSGCCHRTAETTSIKRRPATPTARLVDNVRPAYYGPVRNDPSCGRSAARISRIVGGNDAAFGQFPWQAFIQVGGSRCGGALVGRQHVVTAGHCVAKSQYTPNKIRVTLGDYVLFSDVESLPHEVFEVMEVRLHPNFRFTPQADRYDVAVLILERPVQYRENVRPICLPPKDADFLGQVAYAAGWGAMQAGSKYRPKVLQYVPVQIIANPVCEMWHQRKGIDIQIHHEMMCAGYEYGGRDSCQGDSGGPLMYEHGGLWYLIGVVSAGYSCAKHHQPGIYHRISSSSDWVSANLF